MPDTLLVPGSGNVQLASLKTPAEALDSVKPDRSRAVVAVPGKKVSRPNVRTHKVKKGDTLSSLARKYGTSVNALRALNNLKSSSLKIGNNLRIPGTDVRG